MEKRVKKVEVGADAETIVLNDGGATNYQISLAGADAGTVAIYAQVDSDIGFEPVVESVLSTDPVSIDLANPSSVVINGCSISSFKLVPTGVSDSFTAVFYYW